MVRDSEFLLSQYTDDSLILDDSEISLENSLYLFDKFSECASLRVNIDKTEAIWIGSRKGCGEEILPHKNLKWNHAGRFKLLGIWFELTKVDKTISNFYDKIQGIKST